VSGKSILVTGATRGIGRALCDELAERGHRVFGGGRSWPEDDEPGFVALTLDVTDEVSAAMAVSRVVDEAGSIDVLVNNAGISHAGTIEETPLDVARRVFETNYLGLVTMTRAALPVMREAGGGLIVNVGSAAGRIGVPFQAHYAASKFAVEGFSEGLLYEVSQFGIKVVLVEPGDVATTIWRDTDMVTEFGSPYRESLERFFKIKDKEMGPKATPVDEVAKDVADIIESGSTRFRRPVARMAEFFMLARKLLPDRIFLWAVARNYGIKK